MNTTRRTLLAATGGLAIAACTKAQTESGYTPGPVEGPILGSVTRLDAAIDAVAPADAVVEELGSGYMWSEGPVWIKDGNYLLFSDVPGNVMYKWRQGEGVSEFLNPSGFAGEDSSHLREGGSNGLALDASGALVMADTGNRNLSRLDLATKEKTIIVETYEGKRFHSPNDVVIHSSGAMYFTDPPYGLAEMNDSALKEIGFNGVYRLSPEGEVSVIETALTFPNGVALSPDEGTLYVASSDPALPTITAYELGPDGMPASQRLFFDAAPLIAEGGQGNPDGMAVDEDGRLYVGGPGGVLVLSSEGQLLGIIDAGRRVANCKFGEDGSTLFLTAHDKLARIQLNTRAARWG